MEYREYSICYKTLRDYVKNQLDLNSIYLEKEISKEGNFSYDKFERVVQGKTTFKWGEALFIAKYYSKLFQQIEDKEILRVLLYKFLLFSCKEDENSIIDECIINDFLNNQLQMESDSQINLETVKKINYSNLPQIPMRGKIIRKHLFNRGKEFFDTGEIIFYSGLPRTGKSYMANMLASFYKKETNKYDAAIWIDCKDKCNILDEFISDILYAFEVKIMGNLSRLDKIEKLKNIIKTYKVIIVIDSFEHFIEKDLLLEILEDISDNCNIIMTCTERLRMYSHQISDINKFQEIQVDIFTEKEWIEFSKSMEHYNTIKQAKEIAPEIDHFVYSICAGHPELMIHVIGAVSRKLVTGIEFEKIQKKYRISDIGGEAFGQLIGKIIEELSETDIKILITSTLFVVPVSLKQISEICEVEGFDEEGYLIENSELQASIGKCVGMYFVDLCASKGKTKYILHNTLRSVMLEYIEKNHSLSEKIINNWIKYYIDFTKKIDFCYDNFRLLEILDGDPNAREIENIKQVLSYCEENKLWQEFYTISENIKYFFYTRGISGEGEESIHYKRALAARYLKQKQNEYAALIYHCNVSCKTKSWSNIQECFIRIEELERITDNLPDNLKLKYCYIKALYLYAHNQYEKAIKEFLNYEDQIKEYLKRNMTIKEYNLGKHDYIAALRWHSECLFSWGIIHKECSVEEKIEKLLEKAIRYATDIHFERAIVHSYLIKAKTSIYLTQNLEQAIEYLEKLYNYKEIIDNDAVYSQEYTMILNKLKEGEWYD